MSVAYSTSHAGSIDLDEYRYIYIYIYGERERQRQRDRQRDRERERWRTGELHDITQNKEIIFEITRTK